VSQWGLPNGYILGEETSGAEVAALLKEYRGSYIMTFAGYNAGRGRVAEWVAKHGDPQYHCRCDRLGRAHTVR
jgi:soluble lytic murein transglycosylase-like protein